MKSDLELLLDAEAPRRDGPGGDHFERFVRTFALAELERRAVNRVELRQRAIDLTAELRKLSEDDLFWISVDSDHEGLWRLAAALWHGREPLSWDQAVQPVKRGTGPAPRSVPAAAAGRTGASPRQHRPRPATAASSKKG